MNKFYLIEPDERLRAEIAHYMSLEGLHLEPFANFDEFRKSILRLRIKNGGVVITQDKGAVAQFIKRMMAEFDLVFLHILYSSEVQTDRVVNAIRDGAIDYIAWPADRDRLQETLAEKGKIQAIIESAHVKLDAERRMARVTKREQEVLCKVVVGLSNRLIAEELGISTRTVEVHRANALRRIGVKNSMEAARIAIAAGLLS